METLLSSEATRLYSWWWDSHIPKNSKWLHQNLTDMDAKVKAMIKLIEEDADSFARRAEMYYKKRPELMKLVEEIYRAYRALAERYDHAIAELCHAQEVSGGIADDSEKTHAPEMSRALRTLLDFDDLKHKDPEEAEIETLKKTLGEIEAEKEALLEKLSCLEKELENTGGLKERASRAEIEISILKETLAKLEGERDADLVRYNDCLGKISELNDQAIKAETESQNLRKELSGLEVEKQNLLLQYNHCLEMISLLERRISLAEENAMMLNELADKAETEVNSLRQAIAELEKEKICREVQEDSNESLKLEAENLVQRIAVKDQQLSKKGFELEKLHTLLEEEKLQFAQVEANLQTLQKLHSRSQEEQKYLALKLETKLQMLKDAETLNWNLQEDLNRVEDENLSLKELNTSSSISMTNLQNEISCLKEMKEKLEEEVSVQVSQTDCLQQEISRLREEIDALNSKYQGLIEDNFKLREVSEKDRVENQVLNDKLEGSRDKVMELQQSCKILEGEKTGLVAEKRILLSQLQLMNENMKKVLEKNASVENLLSGANVELEGLKVKSRSLEELCEMLKSERSKLSSEKSTLVLQLEAVELRLGNLESRFTRLEEKYTDLEKEKEFTIFQVKELYGYLGIEKQERACYTRSSESRLTDLENQVCTLHEEGRMRKKEFEEEFDKSVNAQVEIFILQKFMEDLEQKNLALLIECQRNSETCKLSKNVISELEAENLEQQVEMEFLLDEIEKYSNGVHQIFLSLQLDPCHEQAITRDEERISFTHMLHNIEDLKDEKQLMAVENMVVSTLFEQLESESTMLQMENHELKEMNRRLKSEVSQGEQQNGGLRIELETQNSKLENLQDSYISLQVENFQMLQENNCLQKRFSDLKRDMDELEEKAISLASLSSVYESVAMQKSEELESLSQVEQNLKATQEQLNVELCRINEDLKRESEESMEVREKLEKQIAELCKGIDERRVREDTLSLELYERSNEFELWEAEASSFYSDLQISSIREVILENKVYELSAFCASLEDERAKKDLEIRQMNEKFGPLQSEIQGLKSQLSAYAPAIASLKDNIDSLEQNALFQMKLSADGGQNLKELDIVSEYFEANDGPTGTTIDGISDLLKMLPKVKTVEKAITEEFGRREAEKAIVKKEKLEMREKKTKSRRQRRSSLGGSSFNKNEIVAENDSTDGTNLRKNISEISEVPDDDILMKDIQLDQVSGGSSSRRKSKVGISKADDQMLEICELTDQDNNTRGPRQKSASEKEVGIDKMEPSKETSGKMEPKERLTSDANKFEALYSSVQDMKKKLAVTKTATSRKKISNNELVEKMKRRLQEVEEAVVQLAEGNDQLSKDIGEGPSSTPKGRSHGVSEQAIIESETIGRLEFEVKNIQYILQKIDEHENTSRKNKVRRFYGNKTIILLRDWIRSSRSIRRRNKTCFGRCRRPATNEG